MTHLSNKSALEVATDVLYDDLLNAGCQVTFDEARTFTQAALTAYQSRDTEREELRAALAFALDHIEAGTFGEDQIGVLRVTARRLLTQRNEGTTREADIG